MMAHLGGSIVHNLSMSFCFRLLRTANLVNIASNVNNIYVLKPVMFYTFNKGKLFHCTL
jgi:hypothetical protein